jgi:hypothetical protein
MKIVRLLSAMALLGLLVLTVVGCSGAAVTADGEGTIKIYFSDAPPEGVTAIEIKASNIEAHMSGEDDGQWVSLLTNPDVFDLVKAIGVNVLLGTSDIPAGKYTQVRLDITEVTVTLNGAQVKATVPSDKLKLVGNFTIEDGKTTSISLDFDAEKSIVVTGQGKVSLKPVVKLIISEPNEPLAVTTP